jgi:hypothetical protein
MKSFLSSLIILASIFILVAFGILFFWRVPGQLMALYLVVFMPVFYLVLALFNMIIWIITNITTNIRDNLVKKMLMTDVSLIGIVIIASKCTNQIIVFPIIGLVGVEALLILYLLYLNYRKRYLKI